MSELFTNLVHPRDTALNVRLRRPYEDGVVQLYQWDGDKDGRQEMVELTSEQMDALVEWWRRHRDDKE